MHSSSHLTVRSTDVLFLFAETHAGTSSARETHKFGFKEEIISMYSTGFICEVYRLKKWKKIQRIKIIREVKVIKKQAVRITKRRPLGVSKDAPILLVLSHSGRHTIESLGTAANAYSCKPSIWCNPPIFDIVFVEMPSRLQN